MPLLRSIKLYFLDLERTVHECGEKEPNWHGTGLHLDPLAALYTEERRTAALRPWRREHLETLIARLQFSKYRNDALDAIDMLRKSTADDERNRFLFHRIDSRGWKEIEDKERSRILFGPSQLEPDLEEVHQKTQETRQINDRFTRLYLWAKKTYEKEPLENDYYETWSDAFAEAKELLKKLEAGEVSDLQKMHYGGIVTAATIFIRDYSDKLTEKDASFCTDLVVRTVIANADTDDTLAIADATDSDGAAASASVLPILLDFASNDEEKFVVKQVIVVALTHANEQVRHRAADGIRGHLWQRDSGFAKSCINGAIAYARFEKNNQLELRSLHFMENKAKETTRAKLQGKKDTFRGQFLQGELSIDIEQITLQTHASWHILAPALMIPNGSTEPEHIKLLSQMLTLFFEVEQNKDNSYSNKDNDLQIDYKIEAHFAQRFARYLFHLYPSGFQDYIEQLRAGCNIAPYFIYRLMLNVAVEAEKENQEKIYWRLWKELSQKVQEIAIEIGQPASYYRRQDDKRKLIRGMLQADIEWQKIDLENQPVSYGKDMLLQFVDNAGKNPDVFEALTKLMFYFPSIFFNPGIHLLSTHQNEEGGTRLFSGVNTSFYLERSIQRFLQIEQTGSLPKRTYASCLILLNAIVETASPRAYYLREHLVKCRRIQSSI